MPIDDTDPEQRNLTVTLLAFIAYCYGGGKFIDPTISLQVINAAFAYKNVLAGMAWLALVWFVYRFYVSRKKEFWRQCNSKILKLKSRQYIHRYFNKRFQNTVGDHSNPGFKLSAIWFKKNPFWKPLYITVIHSGSHQKRDQDLSKLGFSLPPDNHLRLKASIALRLRVDVLFTTNIFAHYIAPYFLVVLAVLGIWLGPFVGKFIG